MNSLKEQFMILPALSLYYLVTEYIISVNKAEGRSMEPTIKSNEVIIVNRFFRKVLKNDIIIA
jgi:signal peptidase I